MRIIQLGPFPPPYGGVQANIVAIRGYLGKLGIGNGVINLTRHRQAAGGGIFYPNSAGETAALLFKLPARILHLHIGGHVPLRVAALGLLCTAIPGRRSVLTFHSGGYPSSPEGRAAKPASLLGLVFRRFDRIIVVNPELAATFRRFGVREERIRLILPHFVDRDEIAASLPEPLQQFFATHNPVLTTVGLLEPEYDLPRQIEVLGRVREKIPGAGLVIVGSGSLEQQLRDKIASVAYSPHILLAGDVSHSVSLRAILDSRLFLRTTLYDGDAVSVREGLFLGTPVLATDNGMRPEGVRLIPISDSEALVQAILDEIATGPVRTGVEDEGTANLQRVVQLYQELDPDLLASATPAE
jgi:glycosyltransferase involved in cell wall biosynthesis